MRKIFAMLLLLIACKGFSQTRALDSLKKLIDDDKAEDSLKVSRLYEYSNLLYNAAVSSPQLDCNPSIYIARSGIQLANKINRPDLASNCYLLIGMIYLMEDKQDSAIAVLLEGLNTAERLNLKDRLPFFYHHLGEAYRLSDELRLTEYYDHKYYDIVSKQKNDTLMLGAFDLLISLNEQKGDGDTVRILLDKALAIATRLKVNHYINRLLITKASQYKDQGKFREAINTYHEASMYSVLNNAAGDTYMLTLISDAFLHLNNRDSAGWYAYAAVDSAKKHRLKKELADAYRVLYRYHYHFGEYKQSIDEILILDSLDNQTTNTETGQTIMRAQMKYDQEKKDLLASIEQSNKEAAVRREKNLAYGIITAFVLLISFLIYNNRQKQQAKIRIERAYGELKTAQAQLVQSEKMASLGELTAGIAHEIQNPLNFVNNFSDVNTELLEEATQLIRDGQVNESLTLMASMAENEKKINHHGKRADAIVKGMLQHSRSDTGTKEATDINALAGEYLRLSYHGVRAKEKTFNARLETAFDPNLGLIQIVPQDIGRVLLNIYNNAFYAVMEKKRTQGGEYEPMISVTTKKVNHKIIITVRDNGNGITQKIRDKIFQPFFTTKPTGQGTGLGLSLSYDMVKAHGGEIRMETREGEFTEFIIQLPA